MTNQLRDFLEIPNDQLEELNLEVKSRRLAITQLIERPEERIRYLTLKSGSKA